MGGRLARRVRGVAGDKCFPAGIFLSQSRLGATPSPPTHLPAAATAPPAVSGPAQTRGEGWLPAWGGGDCKGLAARAYLVAVAVVQAVPGSRRSQRTHVTAPALQ